MYWLFLAGPLTYLMRVGGLLLSRTRLAPRRMGATLALVSPAVLAALVAPGLFLPQGHLVASPLANPRLLVGLLLVPLILWLRRRVQALLLVTLVAGMGLLCGLLWLPDMTITLPLPLALLLVAGAGLALLASRRLTWLRPHQDVSGPGGQAVVSAEHQRLLPGAGSPLERSQVSAQRSCIWCLCPLPGWADSCGQCGFPQAVPAGASTRPLPAIQIRPERRARPSARSPQKGPSSWRP